MLRRGWIILALIAPLHATAAMLPLDGDMIGPLGATYVTTEEDTLASVARRHGLGFVELRAANPGIDPWLPGAGVELRLPTAHLLPDGPRVGIVINVADQRLYHFIEGVPDVVATYPVGTPRADCGLPLGETQIVRKRENPVWVPPPSVRAERPDLPAAVAPGPGNPLGAYALDLGWPAFVIHGTNKPLGVGRQVSHGCIRMYPEDVKKLFHAVKVGTRVTVVRQEFKTGRRAGALYMEVHPTPAQIDEIEVLGRFTPIPLQDMETRLRPAAGTQNGRINWATASRAADERTGFPVRVTR